MLRLPKSCESTSRQGSCRRVEGRLHYKTSCRFRCDAIHTSSCWSECGRFAGTSRPTTLCMWRSPKLSTCRFLRATPISAERQAIVRASMWSDRFDEHRTNRVAACRVAKPSLPTSEVFRASSRHQFGSHDRERESDWATRVFAAASSTSATTSRGTRSKQSRWTTASSPHRNGDRRCRGRHSSPHTGGIWDLLRDTGVKPLRLPARSPNLNAFAERFVGSVKSECLDRIVPLGEAHPRVAIRAFMAHYHEERSHQGVDNELIAPKATSLRHGHVRCCERLGGVLKFYYREAA